MITGIGVSGWSHGAPHARAATVLGLASLVFRALPAPLVLVVGVLLLSRTPPKAAAASEAGGGGGGGGFGVLCGGCCSLRCALRPLLLLALLETLYASVRVDGEVVMRLEKAKGDAHAIVEADPRYESDPGLAHTLAVVDELRPEQMFEMVQQQLGELVQVHILFIDSGGACNPHLQQLGGLVQVCVYSLSLSLSPPPSLSLSLVCVWTVPAPAALPVPHLVPRLSHSLASSSRWASAAGRTG